MAPTASLDLGEDQSTDGREDDTAQVNDVRGTAAGLPGRRRSGALCRTPVRHPCTRLASLSIRGLWSVPRRGSVPYLRSLWHLGWLAVCPIHGTVLLIRCEKCHCGIRVPQLSVCAPFSPTTCNRCGESLLGQPYRTALPEVVRLQDALLKGKHEDTTEIAGLGTFTWQELVTLADVILGSLWTATLFEERESILLRYQFETIEPPRSETRLYDCRHDSLLFFAWLMTGGLSALWRASVGRCFGEV